MSAGFPLIFSKIADLALARGVSGINRLPGCWVEKIDEHWTVAVNAHPETVPAEPQGAMPVDVPGYSIAVWWHGFLAGIVNGGGGVIAAHPEGASEKRLIADLDAAIREGRRRPRAMTNERQLPLGDRDETEVPRKGELPSEFVARMAGEPERRPHAAEVARPGDKGGRLASPPTSSCTCRERGWQCRHEPSFEERLALIFSGGRQPGEDDQ